MYFESFNVSGTRRTLPDTTPWAYSAPRLYGVALAEGAPVEDVLLWGFHGTPFSAGIGKAWAWKLSGAWAAQYPPDPNPNNLKFAVTGHPASGPLYDSGTGTYTSRAVGYYPGTAGGGTTSWVLKLKFKTPTTDYLWSTLYSTTAASLYTLAVDEADSVSGHYGNVYVWQYAGTAWSLLRLNDRTGGVIWNVAAEPARPSATPMEVEPPAIGVTYVYTHTPGSPGSIRIINKGTGVTTDLGTSASSIGPITVAHTAANDYLVFKKIGSPSFNTLYIYRVNTSPLSLTLMSSVTVVGDAGVPVALYTGMPSVPAIFSWTAFMSGGAQMSMFR